MERNSAFADQKVKMVAQQAAQRGTGTFYQRTKLQTDFLPDNLKRIGAKENMERGQVNSAY